MKNGVQMPHISAVRPETKRNIVATPRNEINEDIPKNIMIKMIIGMLVIVVSKNDMSPIVIYDRITTVFLLINDMILP